MGDAAGATTITLHTDAACISTPTGSGTAMEFASPGIAVSVPDDTTTSFYALGTDAAGGLSDCSSTFAAYTEDSTAPPEPTLTVTPPPSGTDPSPTWEFTTATEAALTCELQRGDTVPFPSAACTSPMTYELGDLGEGAYTMLVRAVDDAGNQSLAATSTYALEATDPPLPAEPPPATDSPAPTSEPPGETPDPTDPALPTARPKESSAQPASRSSLALMAVGATYSDTVLADNPASYWRLNETSGTAAIDSTGGRNGTYLNGVTLGAGGVDGTKSASFDGVDDYVSAGDVLPLNTSPFSLEAWVYVDPAGTGSRYVLSKLSAGSGWYLYIFEDNTIVFGTGLNGTYAFAQSAPLTGNRWHHLVGTFDGVSAYRIYDDGSLVASVTGVQAVGSNTAPLIIGGLDGVSGSYKGRIDEVAVYSSVLSPTRVMAHFQAGTPALQGTDPASPANNNAPKIQGSAPAGSSVTLYTNAACSTPVAAGSAAAFLSPGLAVSVADNTSTTFHATATDGGVASPCSASSVTYVEDSAAPAAPIVTGPGPGPSNNRTPVWSFTGESAAIFECELRLGGTSISAFAPCTSPKSYDLSGQPDGTYTFVVRQRDQAGNTSAEAVRDYTLDTTAPPAPTFSATTPASPANGNAPAIRGAAEATTTVRLYTDAACTSAVAASGTAAAFATPGLTATVADNSTTTFLATASDAAGNISACSPTSITYVEDSLAPAAPAIASSPATPGNDASPTWAFTAEAGATLSCELRRGGTVVSVYASCASPKSYDLSGEPDGDYTFRVRATDAAANVGSEAPANYTLDRAAPAAPAITDRPPATSGDPSPSWSFTAEAGATLECELARGGTVVSGYAACSSPHGYDLSGEPDGDYTFLVRATDAAGNTGLASTDDFTLDRAGPEQPLITDAPPAASNNSTPSWSFTATLSGEPAAGFECELTRAGSVVFGYAACVSPRGYDLSGEPDGDYTFRVRAVDAVGNAGPAAADDTTLDRVGPEQPVIADRPADASNDASPSWSFTVAFVGEPGTGFQCELRRGLTVVSAYAACASPRVYDLSGEPDGDYTFRVRAVDAAGNTGTAASDGFALDRAAPAAPTITDRPADASNDPSPSWSFTAEAGAGLECELARGGAVVFGYAACSSPHGYDLSGEPDGAYTFRVRAVDAAGNTGAAATDDFTLDRTPPPAPVIGARPADDTADPGVSWEFTAEGGATLECELASGGIVMSPYANCDSPESYDLSGDPDGDYTFRVRATDDLGNSGAAAVDDFTLDRAVPAPPALSDQPPPQDNDPTPTWDFSAEPGATMECQLSRDGVVVEGFAPCTSPHTYDLTDQPDGGYIFEVRAIDAAGNVGEPVSGMHELDRSVPEQPMITDRPPSDGSDTTPTWDFSGASSGETGQAFECALLRDGMAVEDFAPCDSPHTYDLGNAPDGTYEFQVRAVDAAGNTGDPVSATYVLDASVEPEPSPSAEPEPSPSAEPEPSPSAEPEPSPSAEPEPSPSVPEPSPSASPSLVFGPPPAPGASAPTGSVEEAVETPAPFLEPPVVEDYSVLTPPATGPPLTMPTPTAKPLFPPLPDNGTAVVQAASRIPGPGVMAALSDVVAAAVETAAFPLLLLLIVILFLVIQDRIDRRDPKLALAPIRSEALIFR